MKTLDMGIYEDVPETPVDAGKHANIQHSQAEKSKSFIRKTEPENILEAAGLDFINRQKAATFDFFLEIFWQTVK